MTHGSVIAPQVALQYLQFLLAQRKFAEAAELCPELLKVSCLCKLRCERAMPMRQA
jgi:hypothetical protein